MALALEDANRVWQKVGKVLGDRNAGVQLAFRGLKQYLAEQKSNPDLQFVPFTEAQCDAAGGTPVVDAACKLYGVYIKKEASDTDNFFWAYDDATNDGTAGDARVGLPLLISGEEQAWVHPNGLPMGTGVVVTQYATDPLGASDGSNGGGGFLVIGAP